MLEISKCVGKECVASDGEPRGSRGVVQVYWRGRRAELIVFVVEVRGNRMQLDGHGAWTAVQA